MLDWFLTRLIFLDCLDQGRLLPLDYFHRPVPAEGLADVGQGVVIGVTNYQVRNKLKSRCRVFHSQDANQCSSDPLSHIQKGCVCDHFFNISLKNQLQPILCFDVK